VRPGAAFEPEALKKIDWLTAGVVGDSVNEAVGSVEAPTVTKADCEAVMPRELVTVRVTV
jgi:hypothetical protein